MIDVLHFLFTYVCIYYNNSHVIFNRTIQKQINSKDSQVLRIYASNVSVIFTFFVSQRNPRKEILYID